MYEHIEVYITPLKSKRTVRVYLPNDYYVIETRRYNVDEDAGYGMVW